MIIVKMSFSARAAKASPYGMPSASLAKAILHKCPFKAKYLSAFYSGFSFLIICLVCCSCGSTKVVPIETIRDYQVHDTIYINNVQYDSIYVYQDKYIDRIKDTILIRQHDVEYRYKLLRDTIKHVERDSIPYEVTIVETKEIQRPSLGMIIYHAPSSGSTSVSSFS